MLPLYSKSPGLNPVEVYKVHSIKYFFENSKMNEKRPGS